MADNETTNQNGDTQNSGVQPTVSEVKVTPPQSVYVQNSMPKDSIPAHIVDKQTNVNTSDNGKESE